MLDQLSNLNGKRAARKVFGQASENGDAIGQIFQDCIQEIRRAR